MTGPGLFSYSTTPASNVNANTGINWDEGMAPAAVNNSARQVLTDLRNAFNDLIWFRYGKGDLDYSPVYVAATQFKIAGIDVTTAYHLGRPVKVVGAGTGTIYGAVTASSFSTDTTVTVAFDSGSMSNEALTVYLSQASLTGYPISGPIRFPVTQSASANPNVLDDYEEGPWTPALGGTATYNSATGTYTKIGRFVRVSMFLDVLSLGSGSATVISGLPFTARTGVDYAGSVSYYASSVTSFTSLVPYVASGAVLISFACLTAAAASMTLAPTIFQNSTQIKLTLAYEV